MVTIHHKRSAAVFRAIADPTRRDILALLRRRRCSVNEIAGNFGCSRPAISKHLRVLRGVGLVVAKREGTARICELNAEPLRAVATWLRGYELLWNQSLRSLKGYVEEDQ